MATEQELKNTSPLHKEFQNLLDQDFKDRKLKENEIIKATVTEITKNFIICDCRAKMEAMIPIEEFKNDDELSKLKIGSTIDVYLERIVRSRCYPSTCSTRGYAAQGSKQTGFCRTSD